MSAVDAGLSRQANRLFQAGHYFQAEQLFRRLAGQDPENWQFALMLGLCRHSQGDLNEALKWVGKSVELGDGQPATHYYLGRIHTDSGKPALAREQFAQAIALDPNHVEARTGMGIVSLGVGDLERAVTELKTALRARADHVPALAALARALVELERIEEAWPHAVRAVEVDANNPMVQDVFGRVLMRAGRLEEAERAFRKSLELNPARVEVHAELAGVLALQRRDREALEQFGRAMAGKYVHPQLVIDASISLERIGDLAQARNMLDEASRRWPSETALKLRLVEVEMLSGMTEQADARLAELDAESAEVILMKARIADARGESSRAAELLEPLVEADVDDKVRDARLLLSSLRARLAPDQPGAAREPIAGLLDRKVPVPDAALTWATVCERTGQYDDACNVLEKLLEAEVLGEGDRAVLSHRLGNLHDLAGNRAQAWASWSRGAWRPAPHAARVQAQQDSGLLDQWLDEKDWQDLQSLNFGDGRPAPVIVAGWPGSGREILLSALAGHERAALLDPQGMDRRLEALGVPAGPAALREMTRDSLTLTRKRFLRGVAEDRFGHVLLEGGWWQASAIPALLRAFPDARILWPLSEPEDLAVQWRVDGYFRPGALVDEYRRELDLWRKIRDQLAPELIEFPREELLERPEQVATRMFEWLGLEPDAGQAQVAAEVRAAHRFVAAGHGTRYVDLGAGAASSGTEQAGE